jgi:hypothetical protein
VADHDDDRIAGLVSESLAGFLILTGYLADLPIPVTVPALGEGVEASTVLTALWRAAELVGDEPISEDRRVLLQQMILAWITAFEIIRLANTSGRAPWRLQIAEDELLNLRDLRDMYDVDDEDGDQS